MRLLLVVPKIVSYRSFLRELCQSLVADGADVHVACSPEALWGEEGGAESDGVTMHGIDFARGMNPLAHLRAARALNQLVERIRPDLVHAHFSAAIFTTALARTRRWPALHATFHGVAFLAMQGWKASLLRAMETWSARRCDAVWVLTDDDRDGLRAAAPQATVHTLRGFGVGCDLERFAPFSIAARASIRAEFGFKPEQTVFAFVGRFVDFKGFALAVRAFEKLADPDARLLLIGARDRLHPTGLSAAEEEALRVSSRVIDAGFRPDVQHCLAAADAMVFPSRREGMPVCAMEALALGVPVITFDTRGCREVVRHGVDGLVLRRHDLQSLCEAMRLAVRDVDSRRQWSEQAVAGRERFSRDRFVAEQVRLYAEALARLRPETGRIGGASRGDAAFLPAAELRLPTWDLGLPADTTCSECVESHQLATVAPGCQRVLQNSRAGVAAEEVRYEEMVQPSAGAAPRPRLASKRVFDLAVAVPAILLLSPLLLAIAFLVGCKLGTPVVFRQIRPGLHGRPFTIWKFRTMTDQRDVEGRLLPDADRLTRFGKLLRSTSLDELPELWNVIRGEMSLVGPRPLLVEYLPLYSATQRRRHDVLPGITGWAQVNGRNAASWPQKFKLDVWYVENQSLWLDLKILARTVRTVFKREGINQPGRATADRFCGEEQEDA